MVMEQQQRLARVSLRQGSLVAAQRPCQPPSDCQLVQRRRELVPQLLQVLRLQLGPLPLRQQRGLTPAQQQQQALVLKVHEREPP